MTWQSPGVTLWFTLLTNKMSMFIHHSLQGLSMAFKYGKLENFAEGNQFWSQPGVSTLELPVKTELEIEVDKQGPTSW